MSRTRIDSWLDVMFPEAVREEIRNIVPPPDEIVDASWELVKAKINLTSTHEQKETGAYGFI